MSWASEGCLQGTEKLPGVASVYRVGASGVWLSSECLAACETRRVGPLRVPPGGESRGRWQSLLQAQRHGLVPSAGPSQRTAFCGGPICRKRGSGGVSSPSSLEMVFLFAFLDPVEGPQPPPPPCRAHIFIQELLMGPQHLPRLGSVLMETPWGARQTACCAVYRPV